MIFRPKPLSLQRDELVLPGKLVQNAALHNWSPIDYSSEAIVMTTGNDVRNPAPTPAATERERRMLKHKKKFEAFIVGRLAPTKGNGIKSPTSEG
jgi:hypothetical protein